MATVQERVIAVIARVPQLDPAEIKPEHVFSTDLGAESVPTMTFPRRTWERENL